MWMMVECNPGIYGCSSFRILTISSVGSMRINQAKAQLSIHGCCFLFDDQSCDYCTDVCISLFKEVITVNSTDATPYLRPNLVDLKTQSYGASLLGEVIELSSRQLTINNAKVYEQSFVLQLFLSGHMK
ncbi:hypothetical protein Nepgr_028858 [Nepenthes gracilis]|uniref:Uncharacterized protein n=1 Tax=Nepenthes gracilis TaxID=150966 RepID=A0AAD3Y4B5_NEPGR|nr:hypothetical protein Nepgr_028858 [Nepenthes gracilis]